LSNRFLTELLRGELGFDSLVVTDDLEMGAIIKSYGIGEACKMALNAGADMLAICADPARILDGYQNVLGAVKSGEISEGRIESSLERIAKTKAKILPPPTFDSARLDELSSQTAALNARLA
jgi:beta-N-acetylhexosaminidase